MQNTDQCYQLDVSASGYTLRYFNDRIGNSCSDLLREQTQSFSANAYITLASDASQVFSITFDSLGRMISPCMFWSLL
ncbi:hypothetical protein PEC18_37455 [Paucibacter sp. O1-1]|nr:hypothetical protein [Paucibacter sp. O1-1]MDA3831337.1 hypothetical protein [Paucibacter sp. O1-1]